MLSIDERCLLLCWANSIFTKEKASSQFSTQNLTEISSSPHLNSISGTEDGSFFLSLLFSIDPSKPSHFNSSQIELMTKLTSFFNEFHFDPKETLSRIHTNYEEESSKWDVMELVFLISFLSQNDKFECGQNIDYFYNFFQISQHLPLTLPIVLKILLRGLEKLNPVGSLSSDAKCGLRRALTKTSFSRGNRRQSVFLKENEELKEKIRRLQTQINDLESENIHIKDILYERETSNPYCSSSSQGFYKQLMDASRTIEKQVRKLACKDAEIFNLKSIIDNLKDELDIFKNENVLLISQTDKISAYKSEISKLKVYKKIYYEFSETSAMCKEDNLKLLNQIQSLHFQISIFEARKKEYDYITRELETLLKENCSLTETIQTLEKFSDEQADSIHGLMKENRCLKVALDKKNEESRRSSEEIEDKTENKHLNCDFRENLEEKSIDAQILEYLNLPQDFIDYGLLHCKYIDSKLKYNHKKREKKNKILDLKNKTLELSQKLIDTSKDYKLISEQHWILNSNYQSALEKVESLNEIIAQQFTIINYQTTELSSYKSSHSSRLSLQSDLHFNFQKSEIDKEVQDLELKLQFYQKHTKTIRPSYPAYSSLEITPIKLSRPDIKFQDTSIPNPTLLEDFSRFQDKKSIPSTIE